MIKPGDTLGHIAQQYYGKANKWYLIAEANPEVDPSWLTVGRELVIPVGPVEQPAAKAVSAPAPTGRTHTIGDGETLSSIAEDHLGHERHWYRLYELNKGRIGDNPNRLVVGMVIAVPD
ncbi:MAG: LysM domain-containing protein [Phycisphaerales bacterium]|nr:LysM domain-containing protein [Phycisphaerales bacterium]